MQAWCRWGRRLACASGLVLLAVSVADACKCGSEPTAPEALGLADAVVVGTVVDQHAVLHRGRPWTGPAIDYEVFVHRTWKGADDQRVIVRRLSRCDPTLRVGVAWLIFARRWDHHLAIVGCMPTRTLDGAATDIDQLGAATRTFPGQPPSVARSLPLSRWIRAHVVTGIGVYAFSYRERDWRPPPWDLIAFPTVAGVLALTALVWFARRRWRIGLRLVSASVLMLAGHVLWTGRVFLRDDWNLPFLLW